ncbi:PASTA domain-containing protein [Nocardiopsis xinjiangensis]|uniref:PASTA domain-containing protein n=1 Tax=Nocardiopsis xinjiangensis TaxID=124285 RepID=UPI00034BE6E3|nr:PASTA domain-containing protein [Nocardiopsis xinjiangensis]
MESPTRVPPDVPSIPVSPPDGSGVRLGEHTVLHRARNPESGEPILVRVDELSHNAGAASPALWERLREIDHPVLLEILEHETDRGRSRTIHEAPAGEPLADIVGERFGERVSRRDALDLIDNLLSALELFHEQGLVHGMVGPETVFLADDGSVQLLPSVADRAAAPAGPREDVCAVGELLRAMVTGSDTAAVPGTGDDFFLLVHEATAAGTEEGPLDAARYRELVRRAQDRLPDTSGKHAASDGAQEGPASGPAEGPDRRRPLLIGAAAGAFLLVAALLAWHLTSGGGGTEPGSGAAEATMPELVGLSPEEATGLLDGLAVSTSVSYDQVRDDDTEAGLVASSAPEAGTALSEGEDVTVSVSVGPVELSMPDLVGQTETEAREELDELGFTDVTVTQEPSDSEPSGTVLETDPEEGEAVAHDAPVTLTVSEGLTLPDLVGQDEEEARAVLDDLGLVAEAVEAEGSDRPEGEVASQSPSAGAIVDDGSTVTMSVAQGPEDDPDEGSDHGSEDGSGQDHGGEGGPQDGGDQWNGEDSADTNAPEVEPCTSGSWSEATNYPEGTRVIHDGREYEAVWWNSDISPEETEEWGPWREVGSC